MNLQICYYIREIALQKNLTKAAQNLYITQSALSQQINKLEEEFQVPLFTYRNGSMQLTKAGKILYENCEKMIAIKELAYEQMHQMSNDITEYITIAVDRQVASLIIAEVLPEFKKIYPESKIHIVESDSFETKKLLLDGKLNLALFAERNRSHSNIRQFPLYQEEIFLAVSALHPIAQQYPSKTQPSSTPLDLTMFRNDNFILSQPSSSMRKMVDSIFKSYHLVPHVFLEINNFYAVQRMVAKNMGVAFIPGACLASYPNLVFYPLQPRFHYHVMLAYNIEAELTDSIEDLITLLQTYCKSHS